LADEEADKQRRKDKRIALKESRRRPHICTDTCVKGHQYLYTQEAYDKRAADDAATK
jgi:hypothetical protein